MAAGYLSKGKPLCSWCGEENQPFAPFCISCGEPLDDAGEGSSPAGEFAPFFRPASQIEHPQPPARRTSSSRLARWESAIGLIILFLALGYSVFHWQRSLAQSQAYREGVAAVLNRDWDRAVAGFLSAGEHMDASRRAEEDTGKVADRNRHYAEAISAAARREWDTAYVALH
jgi:hypothetical protein